MKKIEDGFMDLDKNKIPVAFLDRDGVLIRDHGYVYKLNDLEILPGVFEGLKHLRSLGYKLVLVSNQSGVARGLFSCTDVDLFHEELQRQLKSELGFGLVLGLMSISRDCATSGGNSAAFAGSASNASSEGISVRPVGIMAMSPSGA